jgi:DNA-binding MurR/RpiR family transcriptional regulator
VAWPVVVVVIVVIGSVSFRRPSTLEDMFQCTGWTNPLFQNYAARPWKRKERIARSSSALTGAERRVAEVVLQRPQLVAFGTVAELAEAAGSGAATVVRLASKLGYEGFTALQTSIQNDLASQLRPAVERIRETAAGDRLERHAELEVGNVARHARRARPPGARRGRRAPDARQGCVTVLSGNASRGIAAQFVDDLSALRAHVDLAEGNDVAVRRQVSLLDADDTLITVDVRRYDRWVVDIARMAATNGVWQLPSPTACSPHWPRWRCARWSCRPPASGRSTATWAPSPC